MKKMSKSYFRRIFISIFSVCLIVSLILGGIITGAFYSFYQVTLKKQCSSSADQIKATLENTVSSYREVLLSLSENQIVLDFLDGQQGIDNDLIREFYALKNSFVYPSSISIVRLKDRKWISTTEQVMEKSHADFSNWGVFREANETSDCALYTMAKDALLNEQDRICIAKACRDDQLILGYLLIEIPRSTIDRMVSEQADQYRTSTLLINQSNSVIYHSSGISMEGLGKGEDYGIYRDTSAVNGTTAKNYVFSSSESLELYILQEIPSGIMPLIMSTFLQAFLPGLAIITLLSAIISRFLAKTISDPIRVMIESMKKIQDGDMTVRLHFTRNDEIGQLGTSFDSMTERISELMETIDEEKHSLWVAETRSLSLQMNPHFLYNTLDLIKWNAKLGKEKEVVDITVMLGKVLRRIMNTKTDLVDTGYELEIVQAFVGIQKKHFGERLSLDIDVEEDLLDEKIPKLTIQPIVENAIVHGFSGKSDLCSIRITGRRAEDYLFFQVTDNGVGIPSDTLPHILEFRQDGTHNIGLNNVQRRARLFGDSNCGLVIKSQPGNGTTVTLTLKRLPAKTEKRKNA